MILSKNIKIYYMYSTFAELLILGPILVLFLIAKGLSFTEIMILQSIAAISVILFEVPTGVTADKLGRKLTLIMGSALWAISLTIYILGSNFIVFALAEVIFSLGATFKSGADVALIYDTLKSNGQEKEFQAIEGHARSLALYAQAIGSVIAGFVYEVNIYLPMVISIGFMLVTIIITSGFKEPPSSLSKRISIKVYYEQIKNSGSYILKHEKLKALILYSMIFFVFYRTGFWYFQPYMENVDIPVKYFGIIFFVFNVTAALASKYSHYFMEKTKPKTLTIMSALLIISFILLGTITVWIGFVAILFQQLARGVYRPVMNKYLNKHIPSDKRSTVLSFQSLANNLTVALAFPFMGKLKDSLDIFNTHLILALLMIILTFISLRYMNSRLGLKKTQNIAELPK